jgi:glyoxylase-like metal-dependent hydrolase (beta-lactamase superfamily II)
MPKEKTMGKLRGLAVALAFCLTATGGCQRGPDPLQKAFDAVGGKDALLELKGFSYESSGDRFEPAQGLAPTDDPIKASSFTLSLLCDVENDRLSFDWQREIFDPLRGKLAYRDVLDGDLGYQTGNDSVFNPPGATSDRALVSGRIAALRREFRLFNPQLYLRRIVMDEAASTIKQDVEIGGRSHHVIEVSGDMQPVEIFVEAASGRLSKLQTLQNDHIWGDVVTEVTYGDWSAPEGSRLMLPHQVELAIGGKTLRTARRTNLVVNPDFPAEAFALPDDPRTEVDQVAAERGAVSSQYLTRWQAVGVPFGDQDQTSVVATAVAGDPDVQHLTGGFHHSLAIKLGEGIVVVEPPLNEARSRAVLNKLDELWPGVAVSHLILTHHHFDHMGGIRTYAAAGATIVTSDLNRSYVEDALASSHTLVPDELANVASPEWRIEAVPADGEFSLGADGRRVKARHIPTIHSEDMLVIYLPDLRLLFVSDLYMPGVFPPRQPPPAPFGDWTRGLRDGLAKLDWNIEWLAGGHGGIAPFTDLASHFEN